MLTWHIYINFESSIRTLFSVNGCKTVTNDSEKPAILPNVLDEDAYQLTACELYDIFSNRSEAKIVLLNSSEFLETSIFQRMVLILFFIIVL